MKYKLKRWHLVIVFLLTPYLFWWITPMGHTPLIMINFVIAIIIMVVAFSALANKMDFQKIEKLLDFGEKDK